MAYLNVVKREIKRFYKRPLVWSFSLIIPLTMCLLICLIFSKGSPTNLPVAVLNKDNSEISRMLVRNLNTLPSCNVKYQVTSMQEGNKLLTRGEIYAFLVIPKDFQKDIYKLKQPKLVFYYNNQRILVGGIISKDVNNLVQSMLVGMDAKMRNKRGLPMEEAIKQSNLISVNDHIRSNPFFNYQYFLSLVAFGHILQINLLLSAVWALGSEFKLGTTKDWLKSAEDSILIAFLGKLTPYFVIFISLFAFLYLVYFGITGVPYVGNWAMGIFATILFVTACFSLSAIFVSLNGNLRFALSAATFYVAMGFAFAGVTYPVMSMPLAARIYNAVLPLNYWSKIMINQSLREIPPIYDLKLLAVLLGMSLIGFFALFRIKSMAKDEKRWYQL